MKSTIFILCCFVFGCVFRFIYADELNILEDEKCGQNETKTSSSFSFKQKFTGECYWAIQPINATDDTKISIFIKEIFLDSSDEVTFYRNMADAKNDSLRLFEPLHSQRGSLTIVIKEKEIVIKLKGLQTDSYQRKFEGVYHSLDCAFPITPDVEVIKAPILQSNISSSTVECTYTYTTDAHLPQKPVFIFESFNLSQSSSISLAQTTQDGSYSNSPPPIDFFPKDRVMSIVVKMDANAPNDSFSLRVHYVNPTCSEYYDLKPGIPTTLTSPLLTLDNGTIVKECRWIIRNTNGILGITFNKLEFASVQDIASINNGGSELSSPLLQVTATNHNITYRQIIRTTGNYMWISFKPSTFASNFSANVTVCAQGGYHSGSGIISMKPTDGNDTVFLLEVEKDQVILLNFTSSAFKYPATLSIYEEFEPTNLLATLHGSIWYPVISKGYRMMIMASSFNVGSFTAEFRGIPPGCMQMSTLTTDSYILSGNCNSSCTWIIPPQNTINKLLLLDLQYLSLDRSDEITILRLDSEKTNLGVLTSNISHVPQIIIPADIGACVEITRGNCEKEPEKVALVGHVSYIPACNASLLPEISKVIQITSPNYPDTYPLLANCEWNIIASKNNLVHLAFSKLQLAPNHCIQVTKEVDKSIAVYTGSDLPDDMLFSGDSLVEFDSANCKKTPVVNLSLASDEGFVLNVTLADCGTSLTTETGSFDTSDFKNKTMCIWRISVPEKGKDKSVIVFSVKEKDDTKNYELNVYDGASVRDAKILNLTTDIWSKTNTLLVTFKKLDSSKPSSVITFNYHTISCNSSMQCDNGLCLHPDWRCNGHNDCGDFTDEKNCDSGHVPPEIKNTGVSPATFGVTIVVCFILGVGLAIIIPFFYRKYQNGQYRRFGDISTIE